MRTRTVAASVALAAALLLPSTGATALEDEEAKVLGADSAALSDARLIARAHGWELEPTVRHLQESRRFAALAADLAEEHPKAYAGARFADAPGTASVLRFVGAPPPDASLLVERAGLRAKLVGGARFSEVELQERSKAVHRHLLESGFKQVATATTTDDGVVATVYGDAEVKLPAELGGGVQVTRSREPVARDEHTLGGAPLLDGGTFNCTSGFTVRAGDGTTGVATAGHCTGLDQYQQPTDGLVYGMTHQAEHNGLFGDYEWKTTPHVEPAEFFATATQVREVNSVSTLLPVNTPSCVYGRSSNLRACDEVYSNFVIATVNGRTNWFLMAMDNDNTIPGDSGGPWSFATIADGIHKGDITLGGGRRNMWSRADLLPIALGVSVQTQ
ncbi:MAG TPA: hypothetical protein VFO65_06950 [Acidimicrobiales bacterium]|nr:hypothetical protein [Acidimicrobiales bacterium]